MYKHGKANVFKQPHSENITLLLLKKNLIYEYNWKLNPTVLTVIVDFVIDRVKTQALQASGRV